MLPPFIIEQIRQREERERLRQEQSRPRLELPVDDVPPSQVPPTPEVDDGTERGVIIVDLMS